MTAHEQIQQMLATRDDARVDLKEVLITEELARRPSRPPDYKAENEALTALVQELATDPGHVLQKLCELALGLCRAHSAGVSIEAEIEGEKIFRWCTLAGEMSGYLGGMLPRDFAPCAVVIEEDATQLFTRPILHYPYVAAIPMPIFEVLLVPFRLEGKPIGTVWVVSHTDDRHFDREDERLLTNLSGFAAAAHHAGLTRDAIQEANTQLTAETRHHQALLKTLERERRRLDELFVQSPAFIAVLRGPAHYFERANPRYMDLVGHRDILGKPIREALPEVVDQGFVALLDEVYRTGVPFVGEAVPVFLEREHGAEMEERFLDFIYQPLDDSDGTISGIFVHGVDRTAHWQAEQGLLRHAAEVVRLNERLTGAMRETHHRVKNNLQVISAMIEMRLLEHGGLPHIPAAEFVRLKAHIQALAITHDVLTNSVAENEHSQRVPARAVLEQLLPLLQLTSGGRPIHFQVEEALLTSKQTMALVLILNELVSNALKHGRSEARVVFQAADNQGCLVVRDDGPGFPTAFDPEKSANNGLELVKNLVEIDLQGNVTYSNHSDGGIVSVAFPLPPVGEELPR